MIVNPDKFQLWFKFNDLNGVEIHGIIGQLDTTSKEIRKTGIGVLISGKQERVGFIQNTLFCFSLLKL